jgi:hypothetical protein
MTTNEMKRDIEMAKRIQGMVDRYGGDKTALARRLGYKNAAKINERLAILDVDPEALKILYRVDEEK